MNIKHVIVYREPGRYAGWPANYGIWGYGEELVVGFTSGYHLTDGGFHARDRSRPFTAMQARSLDGGESWHSEPMPIVTPGNAGLSVGEHTNASAELEANPPRPVDRVFDYTGEGFALLFGRKDLQGDASSWYYLSEDRCRTWAGPYAMDKLGQIGIAARTDYIVEGAQQALVFLTAQTVSGQELGSRVFAARTSDGGRSFAFVSWIGDADGQAFSIMPASVRLSETELLVANRIRTYEDGEPKGNYIELHRSLDSGESWSYAGRPVPDTGQGGNPATLTALPDGRIAMTYGYRGDRPGIRAKLSVDGGHTWGDEVILRDDAGSHDIGYPRAALRPDGTLVIVYYYNDEPQGACYIAATLWKP